MHHLLTQRTCHEVWYAKWVNECFVLSTWDQVGGKDRSILPRDGDYEKPMRFSGIYVHLANGFRV